MSGLKKYELFSTLQEERATLLKTTVGQWLGKLKDDENLIIGLPHILEDWDQCLTIVLNPSLHDDFMDWVTEKEDDIAGLNCSLPLLNGYFICIVIDKKFDPRTDALPTGVSSEVTSTLLSHRRFLNGLRSNRI